MVRPARWVALLLVLGACDYGFKPVTLVENLRVLGVRADPPDLVPGQTATLEALTPDPSRARPSTVLWVGCDPDPYDLNRTACADTSLLQDPAALTGGTGVLPPGVRVIGLNGRATYAASADLFAQLPQDDSRRTLGTVGQVLAFTVAEEVSPAASSDELKALFERVQRKEVRSIIAIFRVRISEASERNTNPSVSALRLGDEVVPAGAHVALLPGAAAVLDLEVDPAVFETYTVVTPSATETRTERILTAWYSTLGRFDHDRTALGEEVKATLSAPGGADRTDVVPERRTGTLWAVLRDTRGGVAWYDWPMFVCDASLAEPAVTQVEWPTEAKGLVVLRGVHLGSVLDVVVDGRALEGAAYSPTSGTWVGTLPAGVPVGAARGELRSKTCARGPLQ